MNYYVDHTRHYAMERRVSSDYSYPEVALSPRAIRRTRQPSDSGSSYGRPDSLPSPSISRAVYSYTDYGRDGYGRDDYGQDSYGQDTGAYSNPSNSPASSSHQTADEDTGTLRQRRHGRASMQGDSPRAPLTNGDDGVSTTDWAHYIYHYTDDGGYWKLRPEFAHTGESPSMPHHKSKSRTADNDTYEGDESTSGYVCMWPACDAKHFKRQADLQRHYTQRHVSEKVRESWQCDHKKCARSEKGFGRLDHYRDHLRDYHKEDVCKRNSPVDDEWLKSRTYHARWWRCSRCVIRVEVAKHPDHVCPKCKTGCEEQRKSARGLR
ncbi:hypothetical protein ACHAQF_005683 [Verticillium nonalfalfae]